jgi:acyl-homoserine-lactone acylase
MRFRLIFVLLLFCIPALYAEEQTAEILWDEWGVPHIYAPDNETLFYAFGWAQAQNHGDLLLRLFAQGRGRAAEFGGEAYLEEDILTRTLGIPQESAAGYAAAPDEFRQYLDAFTAGVNAYVASHPEAIDDTWEAVAPIVGADVLAHGARSLRYSFTAGTGIGVANRWRDGAFETSGSNAWALAPSRTANGNAMLVANPHQPWTYDMGLWMEAHFITPDLNLYGVALMGSPVINIGFNEHLGWSHTVNTHDGWDVYELALTDGGAAYLYDGETIPFEAHEETILIKGEDGSLTEQYLMVRRSIHGAILAQYNNTALALRVVGDESYLAAWQWWQMGNATNLDEFQAALEQLAIPMFTIMYADKDGNIMHVFNDLIPKHDSGDWATWNNTTPIDRSHPAILAGDTSENVWTEFHTYAELPKLINPETGWLQNANEPPWTTTYPIELHPDDYPAYFAPQPFVWPRPSRSMQLLTENDNVTFERLIEMRFDTRMALADQVLDDLLAATEESDSELVQQAADILAKWDRRADKDSVGAALFTFWALEYVQKEGFAAYAVPFDFNDPLSTPRGLADPAGAVATLEDVARTLEATRLLGGGIDVPYGDVFRLRFMDSDVDLPASGGFDVVGTFSTLTFVQDDDLRFAPVAGDSFVAVIEFSDPVRAKVLLTYGNSTQPGSPHKGDQLALYTEHQMRDALLTREQVEASAVNTEIITMP